MVGCYATASIHAKSVGGWPRTRFFSRKTCWRGMWQRLGGLEGCGKSKARQPPQDEEAIAHVPQEIKRQTWSVSLGQNFLGFGPQGAFTETKDWLEVVMVVGEILIIQIAERGGTWWQTPLTLWYWIMHLCPSHYHTSKSRDFSSFPNRLSFSLVSHRDEWASFWICIRPKWHAFCG